jgi:hypothetical protein
MFSNNGSRTATLKVQQSSQGPTTKTASHKTVERARRGTTETNNTGNAKSMRQPQKKL